MGGEACKIDISSVKVNTVEQLTEGVSYGTDNGDGTYTLAFGTASYKLDELLSIDDDWTVAVTFTQASAYASNWNSYNFMLTNGEDSTTWTCRCDNWAWGKLTGYTDYGQGANTGMTNTFNWTTFSENFADKTLTLTIAKTDASIIATLNNGTSDIWSCTNSAAE